MIHGTIIKKKKNLKKEKKKKNKTKRKRKRYNGKTDIGRTFSKLMSKLED
jgi:hypothetical protein